MEIVVLGATLVQGRLAREAGEALVAEREERNRGEVRDPELAAEGGHLRQLVEVGGRDDDRAAYQRLTTPLLALGQSQRAEVGADPVEVVPGTHAAPTFPCSGVQ